MIGWLRRRLALWLCPDLAPVEPDGKQLVIELEDGPIMFTANGGNLTWKKTG